MKFWNPMPPGGYTDMFWCLWATAIAFALLALATRIPIDARPLYQYLGA